MGKGGSRQAPADSLSRTTNLPAYADPYFRRLLQGAEEATMPFQDDLSQPIYDDAGNITGFGQMSTYQPYQGERIAPSEMYGDIQASRAMTRGIAQSGISGMPEAMGATRVGMGATQQGIGNLRRIGQYSTGQFDQYGFDPARQFTGEEVSTYMSPYMQAVVDRQKQGAIRDFERTQAGRDAAAVQAGAFGGSRQAVGQYLAEEGLQQQLGDIQAMGQQQAFEQAAQQFGLDRAAQMDVEARRAAELGRTQQAVEQSRQFGAGQALAGEQAALGAASQLAQLGAGLASLGERQRAADIQGAQLMETVGRDIRAEDQARLDLAYEDFQRQRDYPITQYERFAGMLRGVPVTPNVEQQRMVSYNPVQQALGAGISALGLYKGLSA